MHIFAIGFCEITIRMYIPEIQKLTDLLISFLGRPKFLSYDGCTQLQFPCPRCIAEKGQGEVAKYNLEVTLNRGLYSDGGLFHCWSCCSKDDDMKGGVYKLIRLYGNSEILRSYKAIIEDMKTSGLYKLPEYQNVFGDDTESHTVKLPDTFTLINDIEETPKVVKEYLLYRKFTNEIIKKFGIGYTLRNGENPKYANRIIVPSYNVHGELNFWSGRDYTGNNKRPKYFNAPGVNKNDIIFQESQITMDADILLVEGVFDALFSPPNTIALLGKIMSKTMAVYKLLQEKARGRVIIGLDSDTTIHEIKKIYSVLDRDNLKGRISYIRMDKYKDMADAFKYGGKSEIIEILKHQKHFSELELLI